MRLTILSNIALHIALIAAAHGHSHSRHAVMADDISSTKTTVVLRNPEARQVKTEEANSIYILIHFGDSAFKVEAFLGAPSNFETFETTGASIDTIGTDVPRNVRCQLFNSTFGGEPVPVGDFIGVVTGIVGFPKGTEVNSALCVADDQPAPAAQPLEDPFPATVTPPVQTALL